MGCSFPQPILAIRSVALSAYHHPKVVGMCHPKVVGGPFSKKPSASLEVSLPSKPPPWARTPAWDGT